MILYYWFMQALFSSKNFILRPHLYRVRCAIYHGDKILLVRHVGSKGEWTIPGGGVEVGETAIEAISREVHEELKLDVSELSRVGELTVQEPHLTLTYDIYRAGADTENIKPNKFELRDAKWFPLDDLPESLSELARHVTSL